MPENHPPLETAEEVFRQSGEERLHLAKLESMDDWNGNGCAFAISRNYLVCVIPSFQPAINKFEVVLKVHHGFRGTISPNLNRYCVKRICFIICLQYARFTLISQRGEQKFSSFPRPVVLEPNIILIPYDMLMP